MSLRVSRCLAVTRGRRSWMALLSAVPVLVMAPLSLASLARAGEEVQVDGVLHVRNPANPPEGIQRWELEELWRVGGEDSALLLGLPTRVTVDGEGRIYVLDAQLNHVHVLDPAGGLLGTHFREGDGPGEIRHPCDLIVTPEGEMGVLQEFPGVVVRCARSGDPLPTLHVGGAPEKSGLTLLMAGRARGPHVVLGGMMRTRGENHQETRRQFISAFNDDGTERTTFVDVVAPNRPRTAPPRERDLIQPYLLAWDVDPQGRLLVAMGWERYEVHVFAPDGRLERIIARDYEPWRRTAAERERLQNMFSAGESNPAASLEVADIAPTISIFQRGVQATDDGRIWVLPSRGNRALPAGVLARFDVFDARGHFQHQVEMVCPGDPWNDQLIMLGGNRVIRIQRFVDALLTSLGPGGLPPQEGADAIPAVICYRAHAQVGGQAQPATGKSTR